MIVAVAALLSFLGTGFYSYSRGIFLPSLADALDNGERFGISMGFSAAAVTGAIVAPYIGRYLDHGSARKVLLLGTIIVTTCYVLLAMIGNMIQYFLVVSIGMGVGMVCMGGQAWHRSIISWFDHWRGRAISFSVLGASLAGIAMPPVVNALIELYGWRNAYLVFGGTTLVMLFPIIYLFMKDRPEEVGEVRDGRAYVERHANDVIEIEEDVRVWTFAEMYRSPAFWSIGVIFGSMTCVFTAVMMHLFSHLQDIGIDSSTASFIMSATAAFAALGKPVMGWLADYFGAKVTIWLELICQGTALLIFGTAQSVELSILAACLYGFGYAGMSPLRTFAISSALGSQSFGMATGALRFVELPFLLSASPLAAYIHDTTGNYQMAFLILVGLIAVAYIGPLFIVSGGAKSRRARIQAAEQNKN
ncbi:MAG: MFS transporter [Pseudomonadota bacterium]|nr:MFS transporter [Pseudomonadota bacterium]